MDASHPVVTILALLALSPCLHADGLVYKLPSDGSWATYHVRQEATNIESLDGEKWPEAEVTLHATFTIRSIGVETTEQGDARWIELELSIPPTEQRQQGRIITLKMLIPEIELRRGRDPLAEVDEICFWDRDWNWGHKPETGIQQKLDDPARVLYEIERFRQHFPFPSQNPKQETKGEDTVVTPLGDFGAQTVSYPVDFEGKLTGGKGGCWRWTGTYRIWLSDESPFGVVAVETLVSATEEYATADDDGAYHLNGNGVRLNSKMRLELQAVGTDARSVFTDL